MTVTATMVVLCISVFGLESHDEKLDGMQGSRRIKWVASNVDIDMQKDPRI